MNFFKIIEGNTFAIRFIFLIQLIVVVSSYSFPPETTILTAECIREFGPMFTNHTCTKNNETISMKENRADGPNHISLEFECLNIKSEEIYEKLNFDKVYFESSTRLKVKIKSCPESFFPVLKTDILNRLPLNRLDLKLIGLNELPENVFESPNELWGIDISGNNLTQLPDDIFKNQTKLERLELDGNRLTTLSATIFERNTKLMHLDLGENELTSLMADIFKNQRQLDWLGLYNYHFWICNEMS